MSDAAEFVAGTDPTDAGSCVQCSISEVDGGVRVGLQTIVATEAWYDGMDRYYSMDRADSPAGSWEPVTGEQNVPASAGAIDRMDTGTGGFYRVRVSLQ